MAPTIPENIIRGTSIATTTMLQSIKKLLRSILNATVTKYTCAKLNTANITPPETDPPYKK
jgi:hypothetical protein